MEHRFLAIIVIALIACNDVKVQVQPANAQGQMTGGGLSGVSTGGLCSGKGTSASPLACLLSVDGTTLAGTGSAGDPISATESVSATTFGLFGSGTDGALTLSATWGNSRKITATGAWDAGASSVANFTGDGWVQGNAPDIDTYRMLGLSDNDSDVNFTSLDFAIYFKTNGYVDIYESGVLISLNLAQYTAAKVAKIERIGTIITYQIDNVVIYTSLVVSAGLLMADTSYHTQNAQIRDVRLFDNGVEEAVVWQNVVGLVTDAVYVTLTDKFYTTLTVNTGAYYYTTNYRVHVNDVLTNNATMGIPGTAGTTGNAGSSTIGACLATAGAGALGSGSMQLGAQGYNSTSSPTVVPTCAGGVCDAGSAPDTCVQSLAQLGGTASTGTGNNGVTPLSNSCRGGGGGSGGGFVGTASVAGSSAGIATPLGGSIGGIRDWRRVTAGGMTLALQTRDNGAGGGAGSCGRDTVSSTEREPGGGSGGSSGGWLVVFARKIVGTGTFTVKGGAGGNGGSCGTHTGNAGGGGSGGGGAGGTIFIILGTGTFPTTDITGGTGGTGGTACAGGSNGGNGGTGAPGFSFPFKAGL